MDFKIQTKFIFFQIYHIFLQGKDLKYRLQKLTNFINFIAKKKCKKDTISVYFFLTISMIFFKLHFYGSKKLNTRTDNF